MRGKASGEHNGEQCFVKGCQHPQHISRRQRRLGYSGPCCGVCGVEGHRPPECSDRRDP